MGHIFSILIFTILIIGEHAFADHGNHVHEKKIDGAKLEINQEALLNDFADYAFQTSHKLRGPLSSMLGLISIFKKYEDPAYLIEKMKETSETMDRVIREMNESLSRNAFTLMSEKREMININKSKKL